MEERLTSKVKKIIVAIANNKFNKKIFKYGMDENEAFMTEAALINCFGVDNLTNIVDGHMNKHEKLLYGVDNKAYNLYIKKKYDINYFPVYRSKKYDELKEKIMFVDITNSYNNSINKKGIDDRTVLYDCTRAAWIIGKKRFEDGKPKFSAVYAMMGSLCVAVFKNVTIIKRDKMIKKYPKFPENLRKFELEFIKSFRDYSYKEVKKMKMFKQLTSELIFDTFNTERAYKGYFDKYGFICKEKDRFYDRFFIEKNENKMFSCGQSGRTFNF